MEIWFRLPLVVRVAIIFAAWFGYAVLVLDLNTTESADRIAMFVGIASVVGAAATIVVDLRMHHKFGSIEQYTAYRRALRTGKAPAGVDPADWLRWVRGTRGSIGLTTLWAGPLVMFGLASSVGSQSAYRWLPAAAFTLLGAGGFVAVCVMGDRTKRLEAAIKRRRVAQSQAAGTPAEAKSTRQEDTFEMSLAGRLTGGWLVWFFCALLVFGIADLESLVYGGRRIVRLDWAAGLAALVGLVWVVLGDGRDLRRNFASFEQYIEYHQTLRTLTLPADIEPDAWRRRLRSTRRENLMRLFLACFLVAVGVSSILTHQSVYHWITASLFELVAIWLVVNWWTARERLASLAADVERHAMRQSWG